MNNRFITVGNTGAKAVDLTSPIRDSWDFVEAMQQSGDADVASRVSAVFRAMNLTADATSNMPFAVMDGNGNDVDTSEDWQNKIGMMPKPRELIRLWRLSLFMTNQAYARVANVNSVKRELLYVAPESIRIVPNLANGNIDRIERVSGGKVLDTYKPDDRKLLKMWRLDHTTELLPSQNTEFKALANAAGVLLAADWWTRNYFEHGAVKPTVIAVKGMIIGDKREELQGSWARFMRSIGKAWSELAKVINAEAMDIKQIGDGLGDIKDTPVYKQAIENISMAAGMPLSLLLANSANYSTAQVEYASWFRDSITPWAYWMQEQMNDQIFKPAGLFFEFRPEQSEPSQEEEVQRASAYAAYVNAGMLPSVAAQVVGLDLPAGMEYTDLDPEEEEAPTNAPTTQQEAPQATETEEPDENTQIDDETSMKALSFEAWQELDIWKRKAMKAEKRGEALPVDFVCHHIPDDYAVAIRDGLQRGDVKAAFEVKQQDEVKAEGYTPPQAVQAAARRGLELRKKHGKGGLDREEASEQGIGSGVQRATNLANGDSISIDTIRRMSAFFSRHEKNKSGGEDDAGYIAWQLWGGDAGRSWVNGILRDVDGEDKSIEIKALADAINKLAEVKPEVKAEPMPQPVINVTIDIISKAIALYPEVIPHLTGRARWIAAVNHIATNSKMVKTQDAMQRQIYNRIKELYTGEIDTGEFLDAMATIVQDQLTRAFREALRDNELDPDLVNQDGEGFKDELEAMILNEFDFVDGLAADVMAAKEAGAGYIQFQARAELWANRYPDALNQANVIIAEQYGQNLVWVYADEKDHCDICRELDGIVARAKVWDDLGVFPQQPPNEMLSPHDDKTGCSGWLCGCQLIPTDKRQSPKAFESIMNIVTR